MISRLSSTTQHLSFNIGPRNLATIDMKLILARSVDVLISREHLRKNLLYFNHTGQNFEGTSPLRKLRTQRAQN